MLKRTEKFNLGGRRLYLDTNTGKEVTLERERGKKSGRIPGDVLNRFLNPSFEIDQLMKLQRASHGLLLPYM